MSHNIKLLHYRDLELLGYGSRVTIWRKVREGKFPEPIYINGRVAWREIDMLEFFESLRPATTA